MYHTYILLSLKNGKFYIGSCQDIDIRLERHNADANASTKSSCPSELFIPKVFRITQKYNSKIRDSNKT